MKFKNRNKKPANQLSLAFLGISVSAVVVAGVFGMTRLPDKDAYLIVVDPRQNLHTLRSMIERIEASGNEPDFYEAYQRFLEQRADFNGFVNWSGYTIADEFVDSMPRAILRTDNQAGENSIAGPPPNGAQWTEIGPRNLDIPFKQYFGPKRALSGRVNDIVIHPRNPNIMYLASAAGGVWKTTDGGANWTPKGGNYSNWKGMQISSLAIRPDQPNTIFAGAGDARGFYRMYGRGLYRSTDGGDTWTLFQNFGNRAITRILIDPDAPDRMWVMTGGKNDNGIINGGNVFFKGVNDATFAAVGAIPAGDWQDADFGAKDSNLKRRAYFCGFTNGGGARVFMTDDKGMTYQNVTPGAVTNRVGGTDFCYASLSVAASKVRPQTAYLLSGKDRNIFKTTNAGGAWASTLNNFPMGPNVADCFNNAANPQPENWNQSGYDFAIDCSYIPGTTVDVVYASLITLAASKDAGATWTDVTETFNPPPVVAGPQPTQAEDANSPAYSHNDAQCVTFNPQNPHEVFFGNDGGIYKMTYDPFFEDWTVPSTALNATLGITQFYTLATNFTIANRVIGGTQDNATPRSFGANSPHDNLAPNLNRWNNAAGGDGGFCAISPDPSNEQFATSNGTIFRTTDAWSQTILPQGFDMGGNPTYGNTRPLLFRNDTPSFLGCMTMDRLGTNLYGASANHVFRYTRNNVADVNGILWDGVTVAGAGAVGPRRRYRLGPAAGNYANSGQMFGAAGAYISAMALSPSDNNRLYVATSDGELWMSSNCRQAVTAVTFTQINVGRNAAKSLPAGRFITSIAVHPFDQNIVYVGIGTTGLGVRHLWKCSDVTQPQASRNWDDIDGGGLPDVSLNTIALDTQDPISIYYVGTDEGVHMTINGGGAWTDLNNNRGLPYVQVNALDTRGGTGKLTAATFGRGIWQIDVGNAFIAAFGVTPSPIKRRSGGTGWVYLCGFANGDQTVTLTSSNPAVLKVPDNVVVRNNRFVADFRVTTGHVDAATTVIVTASLGGENKSQFIRVEP